MKSYDSVDSYISAADPSRRDLLQRVRRAVQHVAPEAIEGIAYGMPAYKLNGKPLFYFATQKGHLGLYPTTGPIHTCKDMLTEFSTSKGCVRIPYDIPLPETLIAKLIHERSKEINEGL